MKTKKPIVWVVDDDEGMCNAIQQLLMPKYDVDYFLSLEKLNTAFDGNTPDLLILDIMFSRDDSAGLHYLERLRESYTYLPVVICSVRDDWKAGLTAGNLGVTKYTTS